MHDNSSLLRDLVVVTGVGLLITLLFRRIRVTAVIGFIATGVVIGPGGFGLVSEVATVRLMAEMGVVLLLFTVGLEFSIADLRALTAKTLLTGIDHERTFVRGPAEAIVAEARSAIAESGGTRLILGPGCAVPAAAPMAHYQAIREEILACA